MSNTFSFQQIAAPKVLSAEVREAISNNVLQFYVRDQQQNAQDEGKVFDVLVENFSKRSREQLCGRNEQNKMVVFSKGSHHIGETVRVRITGSSSATLLGEPAE